MLFATSNLESKLFSDDFFKKKKFISKLCNLISQNICIEFEIKP